MKALQLMLTASCLLVQATVCSNILMITMGGTKSHKIPFWALAKGLIARNHNVTFISAFPAEYHMEGLEEITPAGLVFYVRNYTNWDLVGARMRGEEPITPVDIVRYGYEACESLLEDHETQELMKSGRSFDLIILDGAYPECALGLVYHYKRPFIYINTVGFYTASMALAGNPTPFSTTPFFTKPFTDDMNLIERAMNAGWHLAAISLHSFMVNGFLQRVMRKHFGADMPHVYELSKNVSFILQNGHFTLSYARPYLPNVAEIACIHCHAAKPLNKELEGFVNASGDAGFVYVSMGSSVKAASMPSRARRIFTRALARLPQRVLWKYEGDERELPDLPDNVMIQKWLPQQDLLGHKKIKAFVTHGGLLSMYETVFHGVPVVTMPVFCDHDSNAAKAQLDGYAKKLELETITADILHEAIVDVIHNPKYREEVKTRQHLLRDQRESPLDRAVYWTEYVIRHNGAPHMQVASRNLNFFQYYMLDVLCLMALAIWLSLTLVRAVLRSSIKRILEKGNHMVKMKHN